VEKKLANTEILKSRNAGNIVEEITYGNLWRSNVGTVRDERYRKIA
jgi:hypothetical protein